MKPCPHLHARMHARTGVGLSCDAQCCCQSGILPKWLVPGGPCHFRSCAFRRFGCQSWTCSSCSKAHDSSLDHPKGRSCYLSAHWSRPSQGGGWCCYCIIEMASCMGACSRTSWRHRRVVWLEATRCWQPNRCHLNCDEFILLPRNMDGVYQMCLPTAIEATIEKVISLVLALLEYMAVISGLLVTDLRWLPARACCHEFLL